MVIILNRHEIPHRLKSPHVVPMYGQMSLRRTDYSRAMNASYVRPDVRTDHSHTMNASYVRSDVPMTY